MFKNAKDWKTTVLGVVASLVVVAGIFWPDKVDPETQAVINTAVSEIVTGVGALIAVAAGLRAKD